MNKDKLDDLETHYSCIIVGGGIVGAAIYRELAHHGISTLIIDKKDFCSQTSSKSSKLLHGGLRYLENFDFALIKEALFEKNLWVDIAPKLAKSESFILPIYKDSHRPLWMLRIGLFLYDLLSAFKNRPHKILSKKRALELCPSLKKEGLKGAGLYHDAVVDDLKLGLEIILESSKLKNAQACNYTALEDFVIKDNGQTLECLIEDKITKRQKFISTSKLIFALGPFSDQVLSKMSAIQWKNVLLPSRGSHIRIPRDCLNISESIVMTPNDGRVIFVIPYSDYILIGTTETKIEKDFFDLKVAQEDIDYLIANTNEFFPKANIQESHIISSFCGVRPLVSEEDSQSRGKTSRVHKVYRPHKNIYSIVGGKYTTFRTMAQDITKEIIKASGLRYDETYSMNPIISHNLNPYNFSKEELSSYLKITLVRNFEDFIIRRLGIFSRDHWKHEQDFNSYFSQYSDIFSECLDQFDLADIELFGTNT
ncbi:glycerol-3-phosphate dehydrogenase/oxidase [bacterium]|nr:glycerol-3-phosphate dehydrogenase/oxidase [bacterium]